MPGSPDAAVCDRGTQHEGVGGVTMETDVRGHPDALDAPWMTQALEEAGIARGATVTDLAFTGYVGTGQMSRNGRFRLTWDRPEGRPPSVIGKFPSDDPPTR